MVCNMYVFCPLDMHVQSVNYSCTMVYAVMVCVCICVCVCANVVCSGCYRSDYSVCSRQTVRLYSDVICPTSI